MTRKSNLALVLLAWSSFASADEVAHESLFTASQSTDGKTVYAASCAVCHGAALEGLTGPSLTGQEFAARWSREDRTLESLYYILRMTMPRDAGNSLSEKEYLDVIAFILESNGYKPGEAKLRADRAAMASVRLDKFTGSSSTPRDPPPEFIQGEGGLKPVATGPSHEDLLAAASNTRDWMYQTRDYRGQRFVPLEQVNRETVASLQVACIYQLGSSQVFQSNPLVYQGIMYVTTPSLTVAIDASNCKQIWRHQWEPLDDELWMNNRGVAIKDGRVFRGTADGYLLALDAADGRMLWARHVAEPRLGETITMAPMAWKDLVLIGPAGSENNISGWAGAFRADNGEQVWRFKTVPGAMDPSADGSWPNPENIPLGGGALWTPFSLDVNKQELYIPVTNPSPDLPAHLRPGSNLYTNSIVALDVNSGKLRWYKQMVANDSHDWDLTQVSPLFRLTIDEKERALVTTVGKDGIVRLLDRDTHETLWETEITTQLNTGVPLTTEGVLVCPGVLGGVEWNGPSYNPRTATLYVNAVDWCTIFSLSDEELMHVPGELYLGGEVELVDESRGWLTALEARNGKILWRYESDQPLISAVISTSGGLVFTGELNGNFLALDADTGAVLYRFNTGGPIGGGIVSYALEGRQYVATVSGQASSWFASAGSATVLIFALPQP